MVLNSIEKLLEKYDNGETTLKEEQQLKTYFKQDEVAPHLESYKVMFQYFNATKQEHYTKDVPLKTKTNNLYKWISVAAVAVLMFSIIIQVNSPKTLADLNKEELMAYNQTMEAFDLVSSKLNKGASSLNALNIVGTQFEKGVEQMSYINEFSKKTNQILKTSNNNNQ
jgi:hypothetical protein